MAMIDNFEKLFQSDDSVSAEKIIASFYDKKNINMKTDIPKHVVLLIAVLEAYTKQMKKIGISGSADMTALIIELFKEIMVSGDREGRKEAVSMLGAIREQLTNGNILGKFLGAEKG